MTTRPIPILLACLSLSAPCAAHADTALGDAGHYLTRRPPMYVLNPDGRAFHFTIYRFEWWIGEGWNRSDFHVEVFNPDGELVFNEGLTVNADGTRVDVKGGKPGVYRLDVDSRNGLNFWYLACSLDRSVIPATLRDPADKQSPTWCFNPFVPRRWHFFVPAGTERFTVRALNTSGRSHREDHGLTVLSPRGQRMAVLWGQANPDSGMEPVGDRAFAQQSADILVEHGSAGRFWSVEVRMGDSHTYSDINLILEGIPPYIARSPEEWFSPETGEPAPSALYDETEFVQSDRPQTGGKGQLVQHWTPCPALGDPDACEIRCPADIALWNPEGRELRYVLGTYLPRNMFPSAEDKAKHGWTSLPHEAHDHGRLRIRNARGKDIFDERVPLLHLHGHDRWDTTVDTGPGVARVSVTGAEHFWTYTYPGTPLVMAGQKAEGDWSRFRFEAGTARNWYFMVPRGTRRFAARVAAAHADDVVHMHVNAPDRTVAIVFGNSGEREVDVAEGLDGKIWHVRLDFGDATRFTQKAGDPRFPSLDLTLDLKGVPPYLAPTWEQWFDPGEPKMPRER